MRLDSGRRRVLVAAVFEQRPYIALVVDLDSLLRCRRVVARRRWLQNQPINGCEDEQLPDEVRHSCSDSLPALRGY